MSHHSSGKTGIAGAGPVGQALGRLLRERGEPVVAVASRRRKSAEAAAAFIGGVATTAYRDLPSLASNLIIAVSDDAVEQVARELVEGGMTGGVALHTCGARGPEALAALEAAGVSCGALHPIQTVATPAGGVEALTGITFGVTAEGPAEEWALRIVRLLDSQPLRIAAAGRTSYHAAAAMASNHVVALIDAAAHLMERAGVARSEALQALRPLTETVVANTAAAGAVKALTGPIARGDVETVRGHLDAISRQSPELVALYTAASRYLLRLAEQRGLPQETRQKLGRLLDGAAPGDTGRTT